MKWIWLWKPFFISILRKGCNSEDACSCANELVHELTERKKRSGRQSAAPSWHGGSQPLIIMRKTSKLHQESMDSLRHHVSVRTYIRESRRDNINTGCCWNKFSEVKSLISPPWSLSTLLETSLVVRNFPSVLIEAGTVLPVFDCSSYYSFPHRNWLVNPPRLFWNVTHHDVIDCIAAAAFQKLHLGDTCETDCGAAASFKIFISPFTLVFFRLLCYVMLATSSSLSLTLLTYLASRLWLFLLILILALFSCRSSEVIVYFSSSKVHLPRSFAVLIQFLLRYSLSSILVSAAP